MFDEEEGWRKKIRNLVPVNGIVVKHIKTSKDVVVSRRLVVVFLLMSMVDFMISISVFRMFCLRILMGSLDSREITLLLLFGLAKENLGGGGARYRKWELFIV